MLTVQKTKLASLYEELFSGGMCRVLEGGAPSPHIDRETISIDGREYRIYRGPCMLNGGYPTVANGWASKIAPKVDEIAWLKSAGNAHEFAAWVLGTEAQFRCNRRLAAEMNRLGLSALPSTRINKSTGRPWRMNLYGAELAYDVSDTDYEVWLKEGLVGPTEAAP